MGGTKGTPCSSRDVKNCGVVSLWVLLSIGGTNGTPCSSRDVNGLDLRPP